MAPPITPVDAPVAFGYKIAWVAVRSTKAEAIAQALQLENLHPCSWQQGVAGAFAREGVFLTPQIQHTWTLVAGLPFIDSPASLQQAQTLVVRLSQTFGEAQYFSSHRVIEAHGWLKARNGVLVRAYAYVGEQGETLIDQGEGSSPPDLNTTIPTEDEVMRVAAEWSVDPTGLETTQAAPGPGWRGRYPGQDR